MEWLDSLAKVVEEGGKGQYPLFALVVVATLSALVVLFKTSKSDYVKLVSFFALIGVCILVVLVAARVGSVTTIPINNGAAELGFPAVLPKHPAHPAEGPWKVTMECPDGSALRELNANFGSGRYARDFGSGTTTSGETQLAMGYSPSGSLELAGYVRFDARGVYPVDGSADRTGDSSFSGFGQFGSQSGCELAATQGN